jgi:hypothetical protein
MTAGRPTTPAILVWLAGLLGLVGFLRFGLGLLLAESTVGILFALVDSMLLLVLAGGVLLAKPWGFRLGVFLFGALGFLGVVQTIQGALVFGLADLGTGTVVLLVLLLFRDEFERRAPSRPGPGDGVQGGVEK